MDAAKDQRARSIGYKTAISRPKCWSCHHANGQRQEDGGISLWCTKADFRTTREAVCDEWELVKVTRT